MSDLITAPGVSARHASRILVATPIRIIHENRRSTVAEVELEGERFARKVYRARLPFLAPFTRSPARHTWNLLLEGERERLPFPTPVAFAGARRGSGPVVITRWFEGDHLHLTHAREKDRLGARGEREMFAGAIIDALIALYRAGVRTTDLAPQNLLVGRIESRWRACLVDLDDVQIGAPPTAEMIIENLAQLGHLPDTITAGERLLGLQLFLDRGGRTLLADWLATGSETLLRRTIAARIAEHSRAKQERLRARGADDHSHSGFGLDAEGKPVR